MRQLVPLVALLLLSGCIVIGAPAKSSQQQASTVAAAQLPAVSIVVQKLTTPRSACYRTNTDAYWMEGLSIRATNNQDTFLAATTLTWRGYMTNGGAIEACDVTATDFAPHGSIDVQLYFQVPGDFDAWEYGHGPYVDTIAVFQGQTEVARAKYTTPPADSSSDSGGPQDYQSGASFTKDEQGSSPGGILTVVSVTNGPIPNSDLRQEGQAAPSCSWTHSGSALSAGDQLTCTAAGTLIVKTSKATLFSGSFQ